MNKDTVKGTMDDAAGRARRQVGEWTGNTDEQAKGAGQQIKGKVEKAWGNVKDAAHDANKDVDAEVERETQERERIRHAEEHKHHQVIGS